MRLFTGEYLPGFVYTTIVDLGSSAISRSRSGRDSVPACHCLTALNTVGAALSSRHLYQGHRRGKWLPHVRAGRRRRMRRRGF